MTSMRGPIKPVGAAGGEMLPAVKVAYAKANAFALEEHGLLNGVMALASTARLSVRKAVADTSVASMALVASVEADLIRRMHAAVSKTMVVELGAAARKKLLRGADPQQRFEFFCAALKDQSFAVALMAQHPLLAKRLLRVVALWRRSVLELLKRLEADWPVITDLAQTARSDAIIRAEALGDPHGGGRCVQRLSFESGAALIYKPRPVSMEAAASSFIAWSNQGFSHDLAGLDVVDRSNYGWVRHLYGSGCADEAGVRRFFHRQGANVALSYVLGATDLHFENVLAVGEYPVIVDWETLFQVVGPGGGGATAAALRVIADSVARTTLLPMRLFSPTDFSRHADLSALGYASEQISPFPSLVWDRPNSDAMRLRHEYGSMGSASALPLLNGERVTAASYVAQIEEGFGEAYEHYARNKRRLLAKDGPLAKFRGRTVRHVFRATAHYAQLGAESWHPRFGADIKELRRFLRESLARQATVGSSSPALVRSEISALIDGDIPFFTLRVGSSKAPLASGDAISLPANGWQRTQARIRELGKRDQERQSWFLRLAFASVNAPLAALPRAPSRALSSRGLVHAASDIGDRIAELAIENGSRSSWLAPTIDPAQRLTPVAVNYGLYSGLSGIALFLGMLWRETRSVRFSKLCAAALEEALALHAAMPVPGFYQGSAGLAFVLTLLGRDFARPAWIAQAKRIARQEIEGPTGAVDLMVGRAGVLFGATRLADLLADPDLLPSADFARRLAKDARTLLDADCGLAHGRAGVGAVLVRWARAVGDTRMEERGRALILADIAAAQKSRRAKADAGASMLAWCRGGLGAAWALMRLTEERSPAASIVRVVSNRRREANAAPLCLCHGELGVVDFLLDAQCARIASAEETLRSLRSKVLHRMARGETCADNGHRIESPGLMLGLAGSGLMLLRLARPNQIQTVLGT